MIDIVIKHVLPAAYSLLPAKMNTVEATALLLAIGLQESRFLDRRQLRNGPARGFWQFERSTKSALAGVITHKQTRAYALHALGELRYVDLALRASIEPLYLEELQGVLEHNDILAATFARLLLWTLPAPLPKQDQREEAWQQYLDAWRPGAPHPETWKAMHEEAWHRLTLDPEVPRGSFGISRHDSPESSPSRPGDSRGHSARRHPQPATQARRYRTH